MQSHELTNGERSDGEHEARTLLNRLRGCLLGGAVGDALGAPVEFMSYSEIVARFGSAAIRDFAPAYGRLGAITDDTQMTLFTAEGLLRAHLRYVGKGICNTSAVVHHAYLRWLMTQGVPASLTPDPILPCEVAKDGRLVFVLALWSRRAPGNTCLSALRKAKRFGEPANNNSKGCGTVMRVAPVGLVARRDVAFELGCETAALTHGHPSGILSAGFLALAIAEIMAGTSLADAISAAKAELVRHPKREEVLRAVENAEALAASPATWPIPESLGQGWVAEEALAIALYCALAAPSFEEAVVLAVNHSGDSDSTGAITGNICGALYGVDAIPARWLEAVELREEITAIADDLTALAEGKMDNLDEIPDSLFERYPAW